MKKTFEIVCAAVVCAAMVSVASADVITTSVGNGADAFIHYDAPDSNHGASSVVAVKTDYVLWNCRKGYFRFDISAFAGPIESVSFELAYSSMTSDYGADPSTYYVYGLSDGHAGEDWGELDITWNNAPGNDKSSKSGVLSSQAMLLGTYDVQFSTISAGDKVTFSSDALLDFVNADTDSLVTLIVGRQQQNTRIELFASKENASFEAPALSIVPEPATMSVLALGGLAMLRRRRRGV